jgi:geranylgeranyl diphosphate synthase type I
MQDVHHGYVDHAERDAIMSVYTHKTGRYTFSLPLIIGARLGDADEEARRLLARLGESLGRIFQIRDDHLGVFGTEGETGKPVGTDLRENKKTLHRRLLFDRLDPDDPVRALFGASDVRPEHVTAVRTAMRRYGVPAEIEHEIQREQSSAESAIEELNVSPQGREALKALLAYNLTRTK